MDLSPEWVVGFVDGEGCFHVSVNRHSEMTFGFQVLPEFVIVQHADDRNLLFALKRFFRAGAVRSNHGDRDCLRIRKLESLSEVCDFFLKHPLKSRKNVDFRKFRHIVLMMLEKKHLSVEGMIEIIDVALEMNTENRPRLVEARKALLNG
jgi:hypothetical protein